VPLNFRNRHDVTLIHTLTNLRLAARTTAAASPRGVCRATLSRTERAIRPRSRFRAPSDAKHSFLPLNCIDAGPASRAVGCHNLGVPRAPALR
jgi:hypothetical protein